MRPCEAATNSRIDRVSAGDSISRNFGLKLGYLGYLGTRELADTGTDSDSLIASTLDQDAQETGLIEATFTQAAERP